MDGHTQHPFSGADPTGASEQSPCGGPRDGLGTAREPPGPPQVDQLVDILDSLLETYLKQVAHDEPNDGADSETTLLAADRLLDGIARCARLSREFYEGGPDSHDPSHDNTAEPRNHADATRLLSHVLFTLSRMGDLRMMIRGIGRVALVLGVDGSDRVDHEPAGHGA